MTVFSFFESLWQDLRYAARTFALNKSFFAVAVVSLALGIGANTAIFQLLDAVRLRMLPVSHSEQLAQLKIVQDGHCCSGNFSTRNPDFTYAQWQQIRDHQQAFSNMFAWADDRLNMAQSGEPRNAEGLLVTGDFFKTLRVSPLLGRLLEPSDDSLTCGSNAAVISYPFWQRQFGGDLNILGKQVPLEGHKFDIAGVTPANFFGPEVGKQFDVALPVCAESLINNTYSRLKRRSDWWLAIIGRLKPGWTIPRAIAQLKAVSPAVFETTVPENSRPDEAKDYQHYKLTAQPGGTGVSSLRDFENPLLLLLIIAGLVLLIACSNLANLMLARASAREREMAVRLAIGANRSRLIRQLLAESFALTAAGAIAGAFLARFLGVYLVSFLISPDDPVFVDLSLDWRVLSFTAAVAVLTCVFFGLTPALRATSASPAAAMKAGARGLTSDRQRFGLRRALVIAQVALSLVLVFGALLFARSLGNLLTADAGFRQTGLLTVGLDASHVPLNPEARTALYTRLLESVRQTPAVLDAASARIIPLSGSGWNGTVQLPGSNTAKTIIPWFNRVSPGYFRTIGAPLIMGRDFDAHDTMSAPFAAIVNQTFVAQYWGGANPLGGEFSIMVGPTETKRLYRVVGVVKDLRYRNLRETAAPQAFFPEAQSDSETGINLIVRSNQPFGALTAALRKTISAENTDLSFEFRNFRADVERSLLKERLVATLSGFFGFLAAALATVGLYGVISYMVARRQAEIGLRIALGASRTGIVRLVAKEALLLLAIGLAIGTTLAAAGGHIVASVLYGLKPTDPSTIALALLSLTVVALLASLFPAFRAARVEPIAALRED